MDRLETPDDWSGFLDRWLADLADSLYREKGAIAEHDGVFYLSSTNPLAESRVRTACSILECLDKILPAPEYEEGDEDWPAVIIDIQDRERYYDYCSLVDSREGAYNASQGSFIKTGYPHIVLNVADCHDPDWVLSHELVHFLMAPLGLPLWLEEGLAETLPGVVLRRSMFYFTREVAAKHRAHWNPDSIQHFWSGAAFGDPESSELAYSLSEILAKLILDDHDAEHAKAFFTEASYRDAGESASRTRLGKPIADVLSVFLGPGDWAPDPSQFGFEDPPDDQGDDSSA